MTTAHHDREPLSNVDTAWLHMDTATNLAIITGVMAFREPLDTQLLRLAIEQRLLTYTRFRQRVIEPNLNIGSPHWEIDPEFDYDYHVQTLVLPDPADHQTLQIVVSEMMSEQLDRSRPLWQLFYVPNYLNGSAIIGRIHHCVADGIALMQVLLSLTDESPEFENFTTEVTPERDISRLARFILPGVKLAVAINRGCKNAGYIIHQGMEMLVNPGRLVGAARFGTASSLALSKLLLLPPDKRTIFKRKSGVPKQAAWSVAIKTDEVKAIGQKMGGTINDILLSALTGALRRYLEERGEPVQGLDIRAIVPVNLRPEGELEELGNRFGLVFLSLPLGTRDPIRRMVALRRRMDEIKRSPEALVALGILNFIGMTPTQIEKIIVTIFGWKGSAVMTNVPGPRKQRYLAGKPMDSIMFWVPSPGNLSLGISIISYAGDVILGVATDAGIVSDPERILQNFQDEFETLREWGRPAGVHQEVAVSTVKVAESEVISWRERCQSLTKAEVQCKNYALPGSIACWVHQSRDAL